MAFRIDESSTSVLAEPAASTSLKVGDHRADCHLSAGFSNDLDEPARRHRLHLDRCFVRLDFGDRLTPCNGVTELFEPSHDPPCLHVVPEAWHADFNAHVSH